MNNTGITIDDGNVIRALRQFAPREMVQANRRALAASSMVLVKAARLKLRGVTSHSASTRTADRKGWSKMKGNRRVTTLENGIRFKVNDTGTVTRINIMGDFRLKWFEAGTEYREKRNKASTGRMSKEKFQFFHPAFRAAQMQMFAMLTESLNKSIQSKTK